MQKKLKSKAIPFTLPLLYIIMKNLFQSIFRTKKESFRENRKIENNNDSPILSERFSNWIKKIETSDSPNKKIIAFNFGVFESNESYKIYLIGSKKYDTENEDWACNVDYEPKEKYFDLYNNDLNNAEW